ncbi:DMT family transporter [Peristeroidobacter agariperforans]|uniref:DMT family transporter n=1 Tax=Peristeroidobacter agariperforans TaxID=268404 RepID=UPI00101CBECC|nr:DMT family transporter [Peristeroidobacter agariperforans]
MSESRRSLALIMLVATMVVWGSTFVITKAAAKDIAPMMLATLRFLTAAIVLLPYAWLKGNWRSLPKPMPWGALLGMALTGIATFTIAFNYALVYGSASQGALIYALVPAAVAVAAVMFLKERMSKRRIAGIVLSIVGVGLVALGAESDNSSPQPLLGAVWMIGAVLSWAAYTIFAKRLADVDQAVTIALVSVFGTLMLVPLAAIELAHAPWQAPSTQAWLGVIFLGVAASALAYIAYGYALRELEANLVGAFINLDPLVGVLTAVLFLGEILHSGQMLGGVIALAGMWLASSGEN